MCARFICSQIDCPSHIAGKVFGSGGLCTQCGSSLSRIDDKVLFPWGKTLLIVVGLAVAGTVAAWIPRKIQEIENLREQERINKIAEEKARVREAEIRLRNTLRSDLDSALHLSEAAYRKEMDLRVIERATASYPAEVVRLEYSQKIAAHNQSILKDLGAYRVAVQPVLAYRQEFSRRAAAGQTAGGARDLVAELLDDLDAESGTTVGSSRQARMRLLRLHLESSDGQLPDDDEIKKQFVALSREMYPAAKSP